MDFIDLPYITKEEGIGGKIREKPEHFSVDEILLYPPAKEGEHLFVNFSKKGITTKDAVEKIARELQIPFYDIGVAGLKDKNAITSQTISIKARKEAIQRIEALGFKVNWAEFHTNKIKPGHLAGNKFGILITGLEDIDKAYEKAEEIAKSLKATGIPNFYGGQRFGINGDNKEQAEKILKGEIKIRDRWLRNFLMSSYQSYLFNLYITKRVEIGFDKLLEGDICKKHDTGGLFSVENLKEEQKRYDNKEISFTGPMFGKKLWFASGKAGEIEKKILEESGLNEEQINKLGSGLRRVGRIILEDLKVEKEKEGIRVSFSLPKGSFATIVLREFMKN